MATKKEKRAKVLKRREWLRRERKTQEAMKWFERKSFALSNPTPSLRGNLVDDRNIPWIKITAFSKSGKEYPTQWKLSSL